MSLKNGKEKMSKSDKNETSRINLIDKNEEIYNKIKRAKSDSISKIYYDEVNRPEINNLLNIYSEFSDLTIPEIEKKFQNVDTNEFKEDLSNLLINKISPIREEYNKLIQEKDYINKILNDGKEFAYNISNNTFNKVKKLVGY
jgi:tryptophanyl-tRNA synthetase